MKTAEAASAASELVSVLEVGMVRPFAMVKVRPLSMREHQAALLREELADVVDQSSGRVLLRFGEDAEVCVTSLRELICESKRCESLGGRMLIVGLSRNMRRLLKGTGLDRNLHLCKDTAEAMRHFDRRSLSDAA
jgi:anti-anti-sigma regulatory factor